MQSLATISGRTLASTVFEDEEVDIRDPGKRLQLPVSGLEGSTFADEEVRTETGCMVVEVIRNGETITECDSAEFTFQAGDEAVTRFERQFNP